MKSISAQELSGWNRDEMPFELLDVREAFEREAYNIGGIHIPLSELNTRRNEIPTDKPVVVYCEKGIRSMIAIQRLGSFENLINLTGGVSNLRKQSGR
ncbi:MAG: rhodanese-like domain-containing protein [Chitinophagales bacterium]|nr:hypothetical protein [Chitinophagaceae bacterium]MCB9065424.1 rhodanese-like domain-containing protein [Chitinophagales bacterium]